MNTDHADVKELIPEFYKPPGDFLSNLLVCVILLTSDSCVLYISSIPIPEPESRCTDGWNESQ